MDPSIERFASFPAVTAGLRASGSGGAREDGECPAFGTKLLYFRHRPMTDHATLILNAFVAGWLERETVRRFGPCVLEPTRGPRQLS
jgi:hypothetical protein